MSYCLHCKNKRGCHAARLLNQFCDPSDRKATTTQGKSKTKIDRPKR